MNMNTHDTIIAALVHKLGGDVTITRKEFRDAQDLEITEIDQPATMSFRITAAKPTPPPTIVDVLAKHNEWTFSIADQSVGCKGCDWTQELGMTDPAAVAFRLHQADMIDSEARAQGWAEYAAGSAEPVFVMKAVGHQHETWQIRTDGRGGRYCAACGATI